MFMRDNALVDNALIEPNPPKTVDEESQIAHKETETETDIEKAPSSESGSAGNQEVRVPAKP